MAHFVFKLESLLNHRRHLEDDCQRELAKHLRQRMILQNELRLIQQNIVESKHALGRGLAGRVDMDQVSQFARFSGQVQSRAMAMVRRLAGVEKSIETSRQRLLEATRARKALELLRQRQLEEFKRRHLRREMFEQDEIAARNYVRDVLTEVHS